MPGAMSPKMPAAPLIVLFDARCGLCERSVAWLARRDRRGALLFAPNDGVTARLAGEPVGGEPSGVVVLDGSRRLVGAPALARALRALGGVWSLAGLVLDALPRALSGVIYRWVAGRRSQISSACGLRPDGCVEVLD